ncbi:MAG: ABC transporter ATP-binding protein, partial [Lachnospiraceae bacterium]|nr:ABC transporter ATP-binding protein [Lachnospiraceae bacterium]
MPGPGNRVPRGVKPNVQNPGKLFKRLMSYVFVDYKIHCILVFILIITGVLCNVQGTMFTRALIDDYITPLLLSDNPDFSPLAHAIARVASFYATGVICVYTQNRIMVNVTQGVLRNIRDDVFEHMERLPIRFFDSHTHGDVMSVYTNDIDTLRQLISQSLPQIVNASFTIVSVFISMCILSIPLTIVTVIMIVVMLIASGKTAGMSGKFFIKQQKDLGAVNGYIEEMITGQKVVKVFCHEHEAKQGFKKLNDELGM